MVVRNSVAAVGEQSPVLAVIIRHVEIRFEVAKINSIDADVCRAFAMRRIFNRVHTTARRQTKFLYYFVFINLLRDGLEKEQLPSGLLETSDAVIRLLRQVLGLPGSAVRKPVLGLIRQPSTPATSMSYRY